MGIRFAIRSARRRARGASPALMLLAFLALAAPAQAERTLFTANSGSLGGLISITPFTVGADGSLTPHKPVRTTARPDGLAVTPDAAFLYSATSQPAGVRGYAIGAGGTLTEVPGSPFASGGINTTGVAVTPAGDRLLVTNRGSALNNSVDPGSIASYAIDPASGKLTPAAGSPFAVPSLEDPEGIAITPGGDRAYVIGDAAGATFDGRVGALAIDPKTGVLTPLSGSPFDLGGAQPFPIVSSPSGDRLFVGDVHGTLGNMISVLDVNGETGAIAPATGSPHPTAGTAPIGLAISPDGDELFSAERLAVQPLGGLSAYSVGAKGELATIAGSPFNAATGQYEAAAASADGEHAYAHLLSDPGQVAGFSIGAGGTLAPLGGSPFLTGDKFAGFLSIAITPTGTPRPSFTAPAAAERTATAFDASATAVPGGLAKRFDWDFGDGTTLAGGGPTPQHTYESSGTYTARLTVTNDCAGDAVFSGETVFTGQTALCSGARQASTTRMIEVLDATPPIVSRLRIGKRFAVGSPKARGAAAAKRPRRGTRIRYRLSEPAQVQIVIKKRAKGKRRALKKVTSLRGPGEAGANSRRFSGKTRKGRPLPPGAYRLLVTATDAAGNVSVPQQRAFRIVPLP